jgi:uncharacterized damage-inducible protein DinB
MLSLEFIRAAYRYNQWANERILAAVEKLSDEELTRERVSSKGSLAADLSHVVGTQQTWLSLLVGEETPAHWDAPMTDVIGTLRNHYDASHERLRYYCERISEESLTTPLTREWRGNEYKLIPWQVLYHLQNHGTQHRAEVGIALLELDASPGDLDAIYFFRED